MKLFISTAFALFTSGLATSATAQSCPNQQLACRISTAASSLSGAARGANHPYLEWAAYNLQDVASDFCRCYYGRYSPGTGVLLDRYDNVEYTFSGIQARGDITQVEVNAMARLRRVMGN